MFTTQHLVSVKIGLTWSPLNQTVSFPFLESTYDEYKQSHLVLQEPRMAIKRTTEKSTF